MTTRIRKPSSKTLKYCPQFPQQFGSIQDARSFCKTFFSWYNKEHRHSGIALMTPEQVHYGMDKQIHQQRSQVLADAFQKKSESVQRQDTSSKIASSCGLD